MDVLSEYDPFTVNIEGVERTVNTVPDQFGIITSRSVDKVGFIRKSTNVTPDKNIEVGRAGRVIGGGP